MWFIELENLLIVISSKILVTTVYDLFGGTVLKEFVLLKTYIITTVSKHYLQIFLEEGLYSDK